MIGKSFLLIILSCLISTYGEIKQSMDGDSKCILYLAQSSIPDAGLGVFTAKSFKKGDVILKTDAPIIPVIDWDTTDSQWNRLFYSYLWTHPESASDELKFEAEKVDDLQVGLGVFPNFHPYLHNLGIDLPTENISHTIYTRGPGIGAYSMHSGRVFRATSDVHEGEELFLNYGENYLNVRKHLDHVPRSADYEVASQVISTLFNELEKSTLNTAALSNFSNHLKFSVLEERIDINFVLSSLKQMIDPISPRIASIFPGTLQDLEHLVNTKDGTNLDRLSAAIAKRPGHSRETQWLKENGVCLDNIEAGDSKIRDAGKGAFALRKIVKGDIVVPVPLLQVMDSTAFDMHEIHIDYVGNFIHDKSKQRKPQLLLNYCFSHSNSSFYLCPTTNAILINNHGEPNAELRWSDDIVTRKWLEMSPKEMNQNVRGLQLNVVALRNIVRGEEITIDYGKNWRGAWERHIKKWQNEVEPIEASEENKMFTACEYFDDGSWPSIRERFDGDWKTFSDHTILDLFAKSYHIVSPQSSYWPCSIIATKNETTTVRVFQSRWHPTTEWHKLNIPRILLHFPISKTKRFYKPYSSKMHNSKVFRHYIEIPDEIFPDNWLDSSTQKTTTKFKIGERIEGNFMMKGEWFNGIIVNVRSDGHFDVSYDDGDVEYRVESTSLRRVQRQIEKKALIHPFFA